MGKIDIGYKYESLVTTLEQYNNIRNSGDKVVLALPKEVLKNLISQFEQNEEYISYDSYGKAIQFDPDCSDFINNLFDAIFEGQKMNTTYEVSVTIRVEAENESEAERMVQNALDSAHKIDEFDIDNVEEYD